MMKLLPSVFLTTALIPFIVEPARADSLSLSGPDSLDGSYTTSQIQNQATVNNTETSTSNGISYTGVTLWSFLGGSDTTTTQNGLKYYGSIATTPQLNGNPNSDLHYYVVGTGNSGTTAVSLGQIDPAFTGSGSTPFVAFQGNGSLLSTPVLVIPGGPSGSTVVNLTSLSIQSVAASSGTGGGQSTSITVSGNVTSPATYTSSNLPGGAFNTPVNVYSSSNQLTDSYTAGIPLATLLQVPSTSNLNSQIVVATATDGYTVVYSYDELLNADGSADTNDILAYAATGTDFPTDGLARTITAGDGPYKHGRWASNLDSLEVLDVTPVPASLPLFAAAILGFGLIRIVSKRKMTAEITRVQTQTRLI